MVNALSVNEPIKLKIVCIQEFGQAKRAQCKAKCLHALPLRGLIIRVDKITWHILIQYHVQPHWKFKLIHDAFVLLYLCVSTVLISQQSTHLTTNKDLGGVSNHSNGFQLQFLRHLFLLNLVSSRVLFISWLLHTFRLLWLILAWTKNFTVAW